MSAARKPADEPDRPAFATLGRISAQAACEQIIRSIVAKDGITIEQAVDDVAELCGYRHSRSTVAAAMLGASDGLLKAGELGVVSRPGVGWVRMDDTAAIEYADEHAVRARRQVVKSASAATAADPEALDWDQRQKRDGHMLRGSRLDQLGLTRSRRLRPLPGGSET